MSPQSSLFVANTVATDITRAFAFTAITDTVITALNGGQLVGFAGVTLPAGFTFYLTGATSITLASGTILVYRL